MNKRVVCQTLLGVAMLTVLLLTVGVLLRPALAAPRAQEGAKLEIVKTAEGDGTISPGNTVGFTLIVTNTGTISATNVVVSDDYDQMALPTIKVLSDVEEAGGAQNDGDVITWQLEELAPDAMWKARYEVTAAEAFEAGTAEVSNVASVQADNVEEIVKVEVKLGVRAPQLTLTRQWKHVDGEGEVGPGATVLYTIRYSNKGTADATSVVLVDEFDEEVVPQVDSITGGGQRDAATIRWNLGNVRAGASGGVSYQVKLKSVLKPGTEVDSLATIRAAGVKPMSASDSFVPLTPRLSIERERKDLNGGAIEPGDTIRFTVRVRNSGAVGAENVTVRDNYEDAVIAGVSSISQGGSEVDGVVEWKLTALKPDAEEMASYEVLLKSDISEPTDAINTATSLIGDVQVAERQTMMTIEPAPEETTPVETRVFREPTTIAVLVGVTTVTALLVVGGLAWLVLGKGVWKDRYFRFVIEGVAVIAIIEAVLVLAMNRSIEPDGAVTILSGIAGYLLGRSLGAGGGSGE
jgi:uncharacterized repeat protein (TIGR01451 family)